MPWKTESTMDQRINLIADWQTALFSKTDLSQKYQVSRPTIDKWLIRYDQEGIDGLKERSRSPHKCPHKTKETLVDMIIRQKLKNVKRGPKKVLAKLKKDYPRFDWPSASTVGEWLKKYGLVQKNKKRYRVPQYNHPFREGIKANTVWSADYKGQFFMGNKRKCYPLTISDNYSRYLLKCQGLTGPRYKDTKAVFEATFKEYGLPDAIRTDNGTPFAYRSIAGLSRLSKWWILLGITPERIKKGCPQENGRHERMHRTLKEEALDRIAPNLRKQQLELERFRIDYNTQRPHEALKQCYPSEFYQPSKRKYPKRLSGPQYDIDCTIRTVCSNGRIYFKNQEFFLTKLFAKDPIGLKEIADGYWSVYFSFYPVGILDMRKSKIIYKLPEQIIV